MIDIDKLDQMLRKIFAEGYRSGEADAKLGHQPAKPSGGTHSEILAMAEASNKQQLIKIGHAGYQPISNNDGARPAPPSGD